MLSALPIKKFRKVIVGTYYLELCLAYCNLDIIIINNSFLRKTLLFGENQASIDKENMVYQFNSKPQCVNRNLFNRCCYKLACGFVVKRSKSIGNVYKNTICTSISRNA